MKFYHPNCSKTQETWVVAFFIHSFIKLKNRYKNVKILVPRITFLHRVIKR